MKKYIFGRWTEEEIEFVENNLDMSKEELCKSLNKSTKTLTLCFHYLGIKDKPKAKAPKRRWTEDEKQFVIDNYGYCPVRDISTTLNRTDMAIEKKAGELGLTSKEMCSPRNLTIEEEEYITSNYGKIPNYEIARNLDISYDRVSFIVSKHGKAKRKNRYRNIT